MSCKHFHLCQLSQLVLQVQLTQLHKKEDAATAAGEVGAVGEAEGGEERHQIPLTVSQDPNKPLHDQPSCPTEPIPDWRRVQALPS